MQQEQRYFLVCEKILPDAVKKTIKAKEILRADSKATIQDVVQKLAVSRSAFYKYKDYIFPFYDASKEKIITISMLLSHKRGVLSKVLSVIADVNGSIITINQSIPMQGIAHTTISIDTRALAIDLEAFVDRLRMVEGATRVEVLGQS